MPTPRVFANVTPEHMRALEALSAHKRRAVSNLVREAIEIFLTIEAMPPAAAARMRERLLPAAQPDTGAAVGT